MQLQTTTAPESTPPQPTLADDVGRRMLERRRVMLTGAIDGPVAERICAQLLVLEADQPDTPVTLYVHSPGGEVDAGFAIYDTMQAVQCPVATVCMGFAASMGQFILCGGAPGMRAAYAHSRILMHQPHGAVQGYAVDIAIQAEQFTRARHLMAELIAHHTGQTLEQVLADGERDRWFTPEEARDYGMIDSIIGSP
jgi:ATP-dependent Clp protease, protease subunit